MIFCHITMLHWEKCSKFVHVIRYLETEDFGVSNNHEIIVIASQPSHLWAKQDSFKTDLLHHNTSSYYSSMVAQSFAFILETAFRRCSTKQFLKIPQYSQENTVLESLFNKIVGLRDCNFIKKRSQHSYFPVNTGEYLGTAFSIEHLRWKFLLFLVIHSGDIF